MNFALLSNNTVETFKNNVIGFPTTNDHQFVLTRSNDGGYIKYSWTKPLEGLATLDFITTVNNIYLTTTEQNIDITGNVLVFDIEIENIPKLCNNYDSVYITVNNVKHSITPWVKHQQIIVDNDNKTIVISSNIQENIIRLDRIHRL